MQIKHKLIAGYLSVALLVELVGYFGIKATKTAQQELEQVIAQNIPLINEVEQLKYAGNKIILTSSDFAFLSEEGKKTGRLRGDAIAKQTERQLNQIKEAKNLHRLSFKKYEDLVNNFFPKNRIFLKKIQTSSNQIIQTSDRLIKLRMQGGSHRQLVALALEFEQLEEKFMQEINEALKSEYKELEQRKRQSYSVINQTKLIVLTINCVTFFTVIIVGISISASISNNIKKLKYSAAEIGKGKLNTKIDIATKDELGALADAFNKMAEDLRRTTEYLVNFCENLAESLIVIMPQPSAAIGSVNKATCELLGYTKDELIGQPVEIVFAEAEALFKGRKFDCLTQKGYVRTVETTYLSKDGREIPVLFSASIMRDENGKIQGIVCVAQDIAERKSAKEELERSLSLLRATLESTADGILVLDLEQKIQSFNQKFVEMWRIPEEIITSGNSSEALDLVLNQLKDPVGFLSKARKLFVQPDLESYDLIEFQDGRFFERYVWPQRLGGNIVGKVFSFRDVTELKQAEEIMRYQAWYDQLTGLPNRILFSQRLSRSLTAAHQSGSMLAVMFLDLDRFKIINDTLGHAVGDRLLEGVAQRLTDSLREGDTVARWGGDEFTLLLPQISCAEDAVNIAERILDTLKPAFNLDGQQLRISSSIGIALYPSDGEDAETLIKNADAALYRAKEYGRNNYQLYTPALNSEAAELLILENSLHDALQQGEFVVYYQPQVNTTTGKITEMEALVRWQHPQLGLVSPQKFIPLAEETGLIVPIGEWVLQTACAQNKAWQDAGFPPLRVAVNLSARQFRQPNLVERVAKILAQTQLEARFLELEITETVAMQDVDFSKAILSNLHDMGIRIAIDDFGTGYSSLSYLKKFPFDTLKIDRSFVRELTVDPHDVAIARAVMALGHGLNLSVVAEGVETKEQLDYLRSLQCEQMQGYFFSHPLPALDITQLLRTSELLERQNLELYS